MRRVAFAFLSALLYSSALAQQGNLSGASVKATGSTTSRALQDRFAETINVKDYGAAGDTIGYSDGTVAASGTVLSSSSASFTSSDVGKSIILHGSGASGAAQQGTITGFTDSHHATVSFTATNATPWSGTWSATVSAGGTSYTNGDTLTVSGGTCTTQPSFTATVSGGVVTAVTSANGGQCTSLPSSPASVTGGTGSGATLTLVGFSVGGGFHYGTDDTSAVSSAIAQGISSGRCIFFPSGAYWLATQSSSISLTNACLFGRGATKNFFPFTGSGSLILLSNSSSAAFSGVAGTAIKELSFYYPANDNSVSTPANQEPLFQADSASSGAVNDWFDNIRVLNAYQAFYATTTGTFARSFISHSFIYGINDDLYLQNGFADVIVLDNDYFGPGAFGSMATAGPAYLQRWTVANGSLARLDSSGGGYANFDGLIVTGGIIQSHRYGVKLTAGLLDVSNFSNVNWDGVVTILEVNGSSTVTSTSFSGGEAYDIDSFTPADTAPVFNINTSTTTNSLSISGVHFTYSMGYIFKDVAGGMQRLVFTGNQASFWGRSTTSAAYYMLGTAAAGHSAETISGNVAYCNRTGVSNTVSGILETRSSGEADIAGNSFDGCTRPILISGTGGSVIVNGNVAAGSSGAAVSDISSSALLTLVGSNSFDILPTWRAPTLSSCGTSPTVASGSNNTDGTITVGTGTVTSCQVAYTSTLPYTPRSIVVTANNTAAGTLAVTASSTAGFTISTSATSINGQVLNYHVSQ